MKALQTLRYPQNKIQHHKNNELEANKLFSSLNCYIYLKSSYWWTLYYIVLWIHLFLSIFEIPNRKGKIYLSILIIEFFILCIYTVDIYFKFKSFDKSRIGYFSYKNKKIFLSFVYY